MAAKEVDPSIPVSDPFREARNDSGVLECPFHGEKIVMLLRHEDVREASKDWETYSSDSPFRVPIPSEEDVRSMRQLPIETDPPEHTDYRAIAEPYFQRAKDPAMIAQVETLLEVMLDQALTSDEIEVVNDFALPVQSRALTYLLNVPETEADTWIEWGIHVFKVTGGEFKKGTVLEEYLHAQLDQAEANPGEDFFSALVKAEYRGRKLTREEAMGFANLAFAGGRDTIIFTIVCALGYLANHPEALEFLREDPKRITLASEEFFRVFMPLTQIGRVCPHETEIHGVTVKPGERIGLCWASANFDERAFEAPDEIRLDRKPNPHLSFGFGTHLCLGAPHARLILRTLLRLCCEKVKRIEILEAVDRIEHEAKFDRKLGYETLRVRFDRL
ncbi:MAG: cytochrome P450 [Verrucomicrobiae bacterium]|nr:cytochrome P450 [Verrucomicrobiae bacterium]MCP5541662.1 cytochrome P450 [Akkermansiaceae bacterium]MCP5549307.1 cytochrome P450 [Akkermansiaceae bacterium]